MAAASAAIASRRRGPTACLCGLRRGRHWSRLAALSAAHRCSNTRSHTRTHGVRSDGTAAVKGKGQGSGRDEQNRQTDRQTDRRTATRGPLFPPFLFLCSPLAQPKADRLSTETPLQQRQHKLKHNQICSLHSCMRVVDAMRHELHERRSDFPFPLCACPPHTLIAAHRIAVHKPHRPANGDSFS